MDLWIHSRIFIPVAQDKGIFVVCTYIFTRVSHLWLLLFEGIYRLVDLWCFFTRISITTRPISWGIGPVVMPILINTFMRVGKTTILWYCTLKKLIKCSQTTVILWHQNNFNPERSCSSLFLQKLIPCRITIWSQKRNYRLLCWHLCSCIRFYMMSGCESWWAILIYTIHTPKLLLSMLSGRCFSQQMWKSPKKGEDQKCSLKTNGWWCTGPN